MQDGFIKVCACAPRIWVADIDRNARSCADAIRDAARLGAKVVTLGELCLTGSTIGDLLWQDMLVEASERALLALAKDVADVDALVFVGAPLSFEGRLFDCCCAISHGEVIGVVPKRGLTSRERRHFSQGPCEVVPMRLGDRVVPFGRAQLFACAEVDELVVAVEFADELVSPASDAASLSLAGATLLVCPDAREALAGGADWLRALACAESARCACGLAVAGAGRGESTTDAAYAGHCLVVEDGEVLAEARPFADGVAISEVDCVSLSADRRRRDAFRDTSVHTGAHQRTPFTLEVEPCELTRHLNPFPFIPQDESVRAARCEEILSIQAEALARRLEHTHSTRSVIGISGGLDSTLALLVTVRAFDLLGLDRAGIIAVTMPGFGTTSRTHGNAREMADALGVELREVSIADAVTQHFADIGHDPNVRDVTYENAQARERTQIVMDIANQEGGMVIGTGDLSELVLGWATFNGDHMSMYGVNGGISKTLVRHLVRHVASTTGDEVVARVLLDVAETPVSPELLPANEDGTIAQQTEDLVGPYELHDFVLYQVLRHGSRPRKVMRLACRAFAGTYDEVTVLKWLRTFYRRFFAQQFKRNCLPDGPGTGTVGVSPRGALVMPSDAVAALWLAEVDGLS